MKLIRPFEADEELRGIYENLRTDLRASYVPDLLLALGSFPAYLRELHDTLKPILNSAEFHQAADEVRNVAAEAAATLPLPPGEEVRNLLMSPIDPGIPDDIHAFLDADPRVLLIATIIHSSLRGEHGVRSYYVTPLEQEEEIHVPHRRLIEEESSAASVKRVYEEVKHMMSLPFVTSEYRALAKWPPFLTAGWDYISKILGTSEYDTAREKIVEATFSAARPWFSPELLGEELVKRAGLTDGALEEFSTTVGVFSRLLPGTILEMNALSEIADSINAIERGTGESGRISTDTTAA